MTEDVATCSHHFEAVQLEDGKWAVWCPKCEGYMMRPNLYSQN